MAMNQIIVSVVLISVLLSIFILSYNLNRKIALPEMMKNAPFEACSTCASECPHKGQPLLKEGHSHSHHA